MKNMVKTSFFKRIVFPAVISVGLFLAAVFVFVIPAFERNAIEQKKRMLLELTNTAWSILKNYQSEVDAGRMEAGEARAKAIAEVEALRYGPDKKDYFWIIDQQPVMVMHPYVHELMGKSLHDYSDPDGTKPFIEATRIASETGEGFIRYKWQFMDDSTRIVPKISYVKAFPDWGWIIGTGIYLDDVEDEIALLTNKLLLILLGITLIIAIIIVSITIQSLRIENQRQEAERQLLESREKYRSLVESSTEGLILLIGGRIAYSNTYVQNMLHYSARELENLSIGDLFAQALHAELEHTRHETRYELSLKRKDGSQAMAVLTTLPVHFADKEGILMTFRDIGEHHLIKQELDDYKLRFENIAHYSSLGVFRFPLRARYLSYYNKRVAEMLGYSNNEDLLHEVPLTDILESRQVLRELLAEVRSKGIITGKTIAVRRRNGEITKHLVSLFLVRDEHKKEEYCDGILEQWPNQEIDYELKKLAHALYLSSVLHNAPSSSYADPPVFCLVDSSVEQVMETMRQEKSTHVLLSDGHKCLGIITNKDIISRYPSGHPILQLAASTLMTSPVIKAPGQLSLSEALGIMLSNDISHLVLTGTNHQTFGVLRKDKIAEIIANPAAQFHKVVSTCGDTACLARLRAMIPHLTRPLTEESTAVQTICQLITSANDAITARIVALAEKELGPPPVPYCFMVFGSAGREEMLFSSDQDNALVYQDVDPEKADRVHHYFTLLGKKICERLAQSGLPYCPGGYMASNPLWCTTLSQWKEYFEQWIDEPDPKNILNLSVIFDLRHGYGNKELFAELQHHVFEKLKGKTTFFYLLAQQASTIKPENPTHGSILSSGSATQDSIELKSKIALVVMFARIYALSRNIRSSGTIERIRALQQQQVFSKTTAQEVMFHFQYLMQLRIKRQVDDILEGQLAGNQIVPRKLSEIDQMILKKVMTQMNGYSEKLSAAFMSAFRG